MSEEAIELVVRYNSCRDSLRRVESFDLAAFRALPGTDVEVVVRSPVRRALLQHQCEGSRRDSLTLAFL